MSYKVLDIYQDLPSTNCKDCGKPGCFQFATSVYLQDGAALSDCPHLGEEEASRMQQKLDEAFGAGAGKRPPNSHQALSFLLEQIMDVDFTRAAQNTGGELLPGSPEQLKLSFFGKQLAVGRDDVVSLNGDEPPTVWEKIVLLYHAVHSDGTAIEGEWVTFRDLPNSVSKAVDFEHSGERIAGHFSDNVQQVKDVALEIGGTPFDHPSAAAGFQFQALPMVSLQLIFWEGDEDFDAQASILIDKEILHHLDQESICFMAESLANRLIGE
jgi:Domain of unknown function (DUF3786)/Putative Fe-S cluster